MDQTNTLPRPCNSLGKPPVRPRYSLPKHHRTRISPRLCSGAGLNRADVCDNTSENDGVPLCVVVAVLSGLPVFRGKVKRSY